MPITDPDQLRAMLEAIKNNQMVENPDSPEELENVSQELQNTAIEGEDVMSELERIGQIAQDYANKQKELQASTKVFNLKKSQFQEQDTLLTPEKELEMEPEVPEEEIDSMYGEEDVDGEIPMVFETETEFKNWLDSFQEAGDTESISLAASEVFNKLEPYAKTGKTEDLRNFLEEYYTSTEEDIKSQIVWQLYYRTLSEAIRGESAEDMFPATYHGAKDIKKIVAATHDKIKKLAQSTKKKTASKSFNLKKTAQEKSMDNVIMWGPDQMRIDPFYRQPASEWSIVERNKGFGLVVDDVWNIDWESIWRNTIMDKYSRPYRDDDGNWVGGYINKRFEVDYNVPATNDYQLKPGQRRKPYLPEYGLTEARMEDMRAKKDRGYEPNSEGAPFNWKEASSKKKS